MTTLRLAWLALWIAITAMPAAAFQVRPVRLDLNARLPAAQLTVSNPTPRTLLIQAEAFDWTQADGRDQLLPASAVILNPPIFELAPGASQVVRVGLRQGALPGVERSHRVWLTQVLTAADRAAGGIQMALRVSLPVFVLGDQTGAPVPSWSQTSDALVLTNAGARHLHVHDLQLATPDGQRDTLGPCYALPGSVCRWPLPAPLRGQALRIEADSDAGPLKGRLDAPAPH